MQTCVLRNLGWLFFVLSMLVMPGAAQADDKPKVKLAVLVVFDQMRADYLTRWQELFGEGGFRRLMKDGAFFRDCHYPYGITITGAGHASLGTGACPDKHGIIENDWFERAEGKTVYCVSTERYSRVPADKPVAGAKPKAVSPDRLLLETVGDSLKADTKGLGKVVSLSFKDRSAVLPAGRKPDACYWVDSDLFVTSTYYRDTLHPWVAEFNEKKAINHWFGLDWHRLRADVDYDKHAGKDDVVGEGSGTKQGRTFPHPTTGGMETLTKEYYKALYTSPFGNELVWQLAQKAIEAEKLGDDAVPDLLCLSFSCNDTVGHIWGPDSQEVLDVTLRSDKLMAEMLAYLDQKIGKGQYVLVMSADHGVCPIPEVSKARGRDAGRVVPAKVRAGLREALNKEFGEIPEKATWLEPTENADDALFPWVYLNHKLLESKKLSLDKVTEAVAKYLKTVPGIQTTYTRTQLQGKLPEDDVLGRRMQKSYHPARAGEIAIVLKPYYLCNPNLTGTTHSMPHPYDTHVPFVVFGGGVKPAVRPDAVTPQAAAAVLARALGVTAPKTAEYPVPTKLFD